MVAISRAFNTVIRLYLNSVIKRELSSNLAPERCIFFLCPAILLFYASQDYNPC